MAASVHRLHSFFVKSLMGFVGSVRLSRIIYEHPLKIFGEQKSLVMGNIKSKSVQINNGAVIEGMCSQCYAEVNPTSFFDELKKGK